MERIKQETKYNINDNVRFLKNKVMFSKDHFQVGLQQFVKLKTRIYIHI